MENTAIIIGATGAVGREIINEILSGEYYYRIYILGRSSISKLPDDSRVEKIIIDFENLNFDTRILEEADVFASLGTTLKIAGSKKAFYAVDYEINAHFADLIQDKHTHFLIVSALGANAKSPVFYNKVKGQLEDSIQSLDIEKLSIFQPSLLIGKRSDVRFIEDLGQSLFKFIENKWHKPFKYKPVTAEQLAHTMVVAALAQIEAFKRYDNLSIQQTR